MVDPFCFSLERVKNTLDALTYCVSYAWKTLTTRLYFFSHPKCNKGVVKKFKHATSRFMGCCQVRYLLTSSIPIG
jgi:hypothetical protein